MSDPITDEQRAQLLAAMGAPMPAAPPSLAANPLAQMAPPVPPPSVNPVPAAPVPAAPASPVATPAEVARHQARTDKAYEAATTNHWMDQMPEGAVEDVQLANAGTSYAPSTKTGHLEPHKIRQPVSFVRDNAPHQSDRPGVTVKQIEEHLIVWRTKLPAASQRSVKQDAIRKHLGALTASGHVKLLSPPRTNPHRFGPAT